MAPLRDSDAQSHSPFTKSDRIPGAAIEYQLIFEAINDGLIIHDAETGLVLEANPAASELHGYARDDFIGLHPTTFMDADSYAHFGGWLQTLRAGDTFEATAVHVRRDGTAFTAEVRGTGCLLGDRLCLVSVIRDVSGRVQAERMLRQQVAARLREQSTLLEISQKLASALELNPGLILDQLRVIVAYTHAALFSLQEMGLVALAVRGPKRLKEAMPFRIPLEGPETLPALLNGHQAQRIADVWSDEPAAQGLRSLLNDHGAILLEGIHAWMWVPMAVKGRVIGGLGIAHAEPDAFTTHQANLAQLMGNQAAITMHNAELYEQAQTAATLEERQRLAQNLHDAVNQSLFSATLIAEVLPRLWERDADEGRKSLEDLRRLTRGAMAEMRGLLAELRPMVLTDAEMGDLLRQLGDALTGRSNIPVTVTVQGEGALPAEVQVTFYRLCQEALNNVARHARAGKVDIDLKVGADGAELRIRDDGRGFDPEHVPPGHYGLSMLRERASAIGASLSIESEPGEGAEIAVRWSEEPAQETP
jgi:PAS domain S-box-containing protein